MIPFSLNFYFRTLAYDEGCFPFDLGPYRSKSEYFTKIYIILSLTNFKEAY